MITVPANPIVTNPTKAIEDAIQSKKSNPEVIDGLVQILDTLVDEDLVIEWHRFDEDDETTWPNDSRGHNIVLGLVTWTKLNHKRPDGKPACFYQAYLGEYCRCEDDEVRFLLDHGNGMLDEPGDDGEDFISPPRWWTYLITPDRAGLES